MKAPFGDEFPVQHHPKPVYPGLGELTIQYLQPPRDDRQGAVELECVDWSLKDFYVAGLLYEGEVAGSGFVVAAYLEEDAEIRVEVRE